MAKFNEKMLEDYVVEKLQEKGWKYVPADELQRESLNEPLLVQDLTRKIRQLNQDGLTDEDVKNIVNTLKFTGTGSEGNKKTLNYLKYGITIKLVKDKTLAKIKLIDYENLEKNEYIVTRQATYVGKDTIRTDVMLYVNGIPLADIELKNPASFSESWYHAYQQIKDYENLIPDLFKYVQLGVAAEQTARYFPIVPWQREVKTHRWREQGINDDVDATLELLTPTTLLDIIQNYLFHRIDMGEQTKVITRYMQYRAAEKIVNRVHGNFRGETDKNKGLVWHWQGSGKTLTMIFAANKLYHSETLENPTIFFIVDRIDLEEQLYKEFAALDITEPEIIGTIPELRKMLRHDEGKGKRGIFLTLIHKFRTEELQQLHQELIEQSKTQDTILTRKNIIAFLDEGHRTQYGLLAAQMRAILKEAFFFGFTGTPIAKKGKNTYQEFSYPPEEKYLDKYFVTESLKDGFTVKIVYQPRLEDKVQLKKDLLQIFLDTELEEIPEEIREDVEEKVKKRLNPINLFLEQPDRIKLIAKDIAEHFNENLDGKYKAMVVAASRKACILYKKALDEYLPPECSEVVMTYDRVDQPPIPEFREEIIKRYHGKETDDIKKEVVEKFLEEQNPKILIVTDMLLTGFDAPMLQTMYLDKPLREHRLLQAIARTNRPYKGVKEAGLILDYVGILDNVAKAFENYDKTDWEGTIFNLNDVKSEFTTILDELMEIFKDIPKDDYERKTLLKAVEILTEDNETGKIFLEKHKALRKIFELLGPDEIKVERFDDYKWISGIYTYYMRLVLRSQPSYEPYVRQYLTKTIKYVHKSTEIQDLEKKLPAIEIDEDYFKKLEDASASKEEKAANIVFTLNRLVLVEKHKNPIYESLVEKVERILELWKEKTKDFEKVYTEGLAVITDIEKLSQRQKELGFTNLEYSLLLTLEKHVSKGRNLTGEVKELSEILNKQLFQGWDIQPTARKNIERELRRCVRRLVKNHELEVAALDRLYYDLIEQIKNYGRK